MIDVPIWLWSWLLTVIGVFGLWMSSRRKAWGFLIGFSAQILWVAYALATDQLGFVVSAFFYGWMYWRNFNAWREAQAPQKVAA